MHLFRFSCFSSSESSSGNKTTSGVGGLAAGVDVDTGTGVALGREPVDADKTGGEVLLISVGVEVALPSGPMLLITTFSSPAVRVTGAIVEVEGGRALGLKGIEAFMLPGEPFEGEDR